MEELLGIVGFSLGASLGVSAVRGLGEGSRPVLREVIKAGIRAWDGLAAAGNAAREGQPEAPAEPGQNRARNRRRTAGRGSATVAELLRESREGRAGDLTGGSGT